MSVHGSALNVVWIVGTTCGKGLLLMKLLFILLFDIIRLFSAAGVCISHGKVAMREPD